MSCEKPDAGHLETNGDLARYAAALQHALGVCAARIEALQVFFSDAADVE